ncbi:MAG TPA: hypothetical protein VNZ61_06735 [Roseomonas sp.]|nr:hypothetical protein [Roseomonas sp.]
MAEEIGRAFRAESESPVPAQIPQAAIFARLRARASPGAVARPALLRSGNVAATPRD